MLSRRLQSFVWVTLAVNVAVILWGAGVRATGSGAGWRKPLAPVQRGGGAPRPAVQTVIEFTHRATSGLALVLVVVLVAWVFRRPAAPSRPRGGDLVLRVHPRRGHGGGGDLLSTSS